ncbi:nuclear transport factor 2 family protein [Mycobacterium europaeum]|uniref:YybH family protein n=1 Tax=Mycobacterium europaeum TaxID=761804 RepID=UPI002ADFEF7B|nr:nuclear transport factor 2 family protein [Mycobacterium europaeum]MEA1161882.1 nuclear transport factor 2 family protein [Mycobacterium europaeum]
MTQGATVREGDAAEIMRLHREFVDANSPLDSRYLRRRVSADPGELVWYNLNGSAYVGQDHIAALWDTLSANMNEQAVSAELRDERVEVEGDVAWVTYLSHYQADFGELGTYDGGMRSTEIWRRRGGEWRLVHTHFSAHVPDQMGGR